MEEKQPRKPPRTFRLNPKSIKRAKTVRVGRRGLHDLDEYFRGISGFSLNIIGDSEHVTTYGEVSNHGIYVLSELFKRHAPTSKFPTSGRNFFDLGSGVGRVVIGMALLVPEIHSNGIEIVPERIRMSQTALSRIHSRSLGSRIQIRQGNFLDSAISYNSVCWIFISNLPFKPEIQRALAQRLERECSPGCVIICSKELPFSTDVMRFERVDTGVVVPMTWSATSTCHVYRRVLKI
jgi:hypothetical protein